MVVPVVSSGLDLCCNLQPTHTHPSADDHLDPDTPALPQLYGDKDGHLLLVFLEDAARLLFTDDMHVTGFKTSVAKAKGTKKRGRDRAEEEKEEDDDGEDATAEAAPKRKQPRCKKCGGLMQGHRRGEPCPPGAGEAV